MSAQVLILCGSDSDLPVVRQAVDFFKDNDIAYEIHIASAHRTAAHTAELARQAEANGVRVIICAAGGAAHLAGCVAAQTILPVIGIPIKNDTLKGVDALYATVQMPPGIPVATVAINGAKNAAILALQMLALTDTAAADKMRAFKAKLAADNLAKDERLRDMGVEAYMEAYLDKKKK